MLYKIIQKAFCLAASFSLLCLPAFAYDFPGKGDRQSWLQACELSNQAGQLFQMGNFSDAFNGFEKSLQIYGYDAVLFYNAGVAHQTFAYLPANASQKMAELQNAEKCFVEAMKLKPTEVQILAHLANVQVELGKNQESMENLQKILALANATEADKANATQAMATVKQKLATQSSSTPAGSSSSSGASDNSKQTAAAINISDWKTYQSGNALSFKYPNGWSVSTDQKTGEVTMTHTDGSKISIFPFFVTKKITAAEAPGFFAGFTKVFEPNETWSKPEAIGPNALRTMFANQKEESVAALVLNPVANGTAGTICVVKTGKGNLQNLATNLVPQIMASVQINPSKESSASVGSGAISSSDTTSSAPDQSDAPAQSETDSAKPAEPLPTDATASSAKDEESLPTSEAGMDSENEASAPAEETNPAATNGSTSGVAPTAFNGWTTFRDPDQNSFTVEVPAGWKVEGGMVRPVPIDARPWVKTTSPDGLITAFIGDGKLPPFTMPNASLSTLGFYEGRKYNGSEIRRYIPARRFAELYALKYMKPYFKNIQVVEQHDHPDVARDVNGTVGATRSEAASIKLNAMYGSLPAVSYYLAVTKATVMNGTGMWWVTKVAGSVGPADREAAVLGVIMHMLQTFQVNPEWSGQAISTAGQVSRNYRAAAQQRSAAIMNNYWSQQAANDRLHQGYWDRQASQDRAANNFSNAIRGVENVQDPNTGTKYQVEYGPQYHWIDNLGNYTNTEHSAPGPEWRQLLSVP